MQRICQDDYNEIFYSYQSLLNHHLKQDRESRWIRCGIQTLKLKPLVTASPLLTNPAAFAGGVSVDAIDDTVKNLGLAMRVERDLYPVRSTAYKSILDRAKIGGSVLPKLKRETLADVLNTCFAEQKSNALVLIREEKVSAVHSGDERDYSVLPIAQLLSLLQKKLDARFPGNQFETGYSDHAVTGASWTMPNQKEDLIGSYTDLLKAQGRLRMAEKLIPGIRFLTSDTGVASAKVSAMLFGSDMPILIGGCVEVDHRHQRTVSDFDAALDQLFVRFGDTVKKLQELTVVHLDYPVNAMSRVCKKLSLPKKEALEAIRMFETTNGDQPATAHDVFVAMQEIVFTLHSKKTPQSKLLTLQENLSRAMYLDWEAYDLAKAVTY